MLIEGAEIKTDLNQDITFNIQASGKAFKILSDSLYSNKPAAIIRELCCNAYDSHIMAGTPELPFEVTLPSVLSPTLVIQDYGIGLSKEEVSTIYQTYFASTKSGSNDCIGGLGLGSKTPFSYTTTFTVIATKDGEKNTFLAFISGDGFPALNHLSSVKTDEHNGVRIQIPIMPDDISRFNNTAQTILPWFDVQPKIMNDGHPGFSSVIADIEQFKRDGYIQIDNKRQYVNFNYLALMGNVIYPIDMNQVVGGNDITKQISAFINNDYRQMVISFDIGELDVAPSRESLSYENKTADTILKRITEVLNHCKKDFEEIWDSKEAFLDKMVATSERYSNYLRYYGYRLIGDTSRFVIDNSPQPREIAWEQAVLHVIGNNRSIISINPTMGSRFSQDMLSMAGLIQRRKGKIAIVPATQKSLTPWFNRYKNAGLDEYFAFLVVRNHYRNTYTEELDKEFFNTESTQIISIDDLKAQIREAEKEQSPDKTPRARFVHPQDRVEDIETGRSIFLNSIKKDAMVFIACRRDDIDEWKTFYRMIYNDKTIVAISSKHINRVIKNGFTILNTNRGSKYSEDESKLVLRNFYSQFRSADEAAKHILWFMVYHDINNSMDCLSRDYRIFSSKSVINYFGERFTEQLKKFLPDDIMFDESSQVSWDSANRFGALIYGYKLVYALCKDVEQSFIAILDDLYERYPIMDLHPYGGSTKGAEIILNNIKLTENLKSKIKLLKKEQ